MKKIKLGELINSEIIEGKYLSSRMDFEHLYTEEEVEETQFFRSEGKVLYQPIIFSLPIQLLAYYTAVLKKTDVDQPRNLAKSVTVE